MKPGPIIPSNVASLKSLTVTMAVMSYLACLAIGALILVDRAVTSWTSGLAREMTVQVRQVKSADIDVEVEKVRVLLDGFPGIVSVEVLGGVCGIGAGVAFAQISLMDALRGSDLGRISRFENRVAKNDFLFASEALLPFEAATESGSASLLDCVVGAELTSYRAGMGSLL